LGKSRDELPGPLHVAQELIEALPVPVFFKDRDGKYLGVNKAWEDFVGVPRETFIGKEVHDLYPQSPRVADRHYAMDQELWRHPGSQSYEIPVTTRDGRVRHTLYYKATFTRADGQVAGLIGTIIDITERKELERRFSETFNQAAVGIVHTGLDGRYLQVNQKFCEMLGYGESELVGHAAAEFTHPEDRELGRQYRKLLWEGELDKFSEEKRYLRRDGGTVWTNRTVSLARDDAGQPMYFIRVIEDITQRKQAEAALREAHGALARKALELTRSNAELEQFAYVASHDLQEPLRMISSYTQLLLRRYGDRLDAEAREFMDFVVDGATRMKQLIEDLLAYSRVGTRGKEFQPVECEGALLKALANLRAAIEASGATVTHDPLPTVEGDEVQLTQLLQNLVGNALKFKGAEAPRIHVGVAERADGWEFAVTDNGIGIDPQYFERIFMVFQRLHSKGEYPGTGIGLAICKKVVDRHGGRIRVESRPGHGSTFCFTLPRKGGHAHG
ncbi:MAG: PAS domain S-box protein, partial [Betaproteobacteria bacterium]|nr:PAS domain S-box protein [Betaproteobacteria bacterium]